MIARGHTLISISIARFRQQNLPFNCPKAFSITIRAFSVTITIRTIYKKNISPYRFSHPLKTLSSHMKEEGMLDLPTKKQVLDLCLEQSFQQSFCTILQYLI